VEDCAADEARGSGEQNAEGRFPRRLAHLLDVLKAGSRFLALRRSLLVLLLYSEIGDKMHVSGWCCVHMHYGLLAHYLQLGSFACIL
jgi:hypothetical protein